MAEDNNETSLKQIIQDMTGGEVSVYQGTVISASPLQIQIANDDKLIITEANTYVPRHLQDYKTTVDISGGTLESVTQTAGSHTHSVSGNAETAGSHTHSLNISIGSGGDPAHTHSASGSAESAGDHSHSVNGTAASAGDHTHALATWAVYGASMTVYNALKVGETVHILSFNHGKQYYVLDRV